MRLHRSHSLCQVGVVVLIKGQSTLRPISFPFYVTIILVELWGSTESVPGLLSTKRVAVGIRFLIRFQESVSSSVKLRAEPQ